MKTFGERLRQRRDGLSLTRKELATQAGCSTFNPSVSPRKSSLAIFPTPWIGHERELEQLAQLFRDPQYRPLIIHR